jgi:hypothetical protein
MHFHSDDVRSGNEQRSGKGEGIRTGRVATRRLSGGETAVGHGAIGDANAHSLGAVDIEHRAVVEISAGVHREAGQIIRHVHFRAEVVSVAGRHPVGCDAGSVQRGANQRNNRRVVLKCKQT